MSWSRGPGYPLSLRCAKCKGVDNGRGYDLVATGRVKKLPHPRGGMRMLTHHKAEYRCTGCGHVGWSRHSTMLRLLRRVTPPRDVNSIT